MISQKKELIYLFEKNLLYSVDDLMNLMAFPNKQSLRTVISALKNPEYTNPPVDLVQIHCKDRIKRWGLRGVTRIYKENLC